jgi:hypothetical protein
MRKWLWWLRQDEEGQQRIERAREESREIEQRIDRELDEERSRIARIKKIRATDHIADLFDDAFRMGRE